MGDLQRNSTISSAKQRLQKRKQTTRGTLQRQASSKIILTSTKNVEPTLKKAGLSQLHVDIPWRKQNMTGLEKRRTKILRHGEGLQQNKFNFYLCLTLVCNENLI